MFNIGPKSDMIGLNGNRILLQIFAIVSLQYTLIWWHISTSTMSFCRNKISQKFLNCDKNPLVKWALPFHNCITFCMTTPQKLACWLLHSDAACGQAYCKPPGARPVAPRKTNVRYLFVPCCTCCMADVCDVNVNNHDSLKSRMSTTH